MSSPAPTVSSPTGPASAEAERRLAAREDIQRVIDAFAEQVHSILEHDRLSIYLLTPDGGQLERLCVATSPLIPGEGEMLSLEHVGVARALRRNEAIVSGDFGIDERIRGRADDVIAAAGFHAIVSVPLRMGGRPVGLMNFVSRTPGFYSEEDAVVAQQIANQVSAFLLNLRLQEAMRLMIEREAVERERNRVAREFHDTLAQVLAELALKADALAAGTSTLDTSAWGHASAVRDLAQRALEDVRRSLHNLMPAELEESTLAEAMEERLEDLAQEYGTETLLEVEGPVNALPEDVQITVFRIFQQAVANAHQHAQASAITVALSCGGQLTLTVRDNGCGFREQPGDHVADRFGLQIMHDRARSIGGELAVTSDRGSGTQVRLSVASVPAARGRDTLSSRRAPRGQIRSVIRVLVVDDHAMVRESLCDRLRHQDDIRVVGDVETGAEALRALDRQRPDVVLLDVDLPDRTGVEIAREIATRKPETGILMMSAFVDDDTINAAMDAGARGYVSKSTGLDPLVRAIRTAHEGAEVFNVGRRVTRRSGAALTERELQVLHALAHGRTNAEIGAELHLAVKTVERIVATTVDKVGARNRTHAVAKALAQKLISPGDLDA